MKMTDRKEGTSLYREQRAKAQEYCPVVPHELLVAILTNDR